MHMLLVQEKMPPPHCQGNISFRSLLPRDKNAPPDSGWAKLNHAHGILFTFVFSFNISVSQEVCQKQVHETQRGRAQLVQAILSSLEMQILNSFTFNGACCKCEIYEMYFVFKVTGKLLYFSEIYCICSTQQQRADEVLLK